MTSWLIPVATTWSGRVFGDLWPAKKMVQFVMCRTKNSVSFLHRAEREVDESDNHKKDFPLDVIFQNVTVCNF